VTLPEEAVPPVRVPLVVEIGCPEHVGSTGAKSWKVTVPAGDTPPEIVAESETTPPAGTEPEGVVEMDGDALVTTTGSAPQDEVAELLLASPA